MDSSAITYSACLFDLYDTLVYLDEQAYHCKNELIARRTGISTVDFVPAWKSLVRKSNLGCFPRTEDRAAEVLKLLGGSADPLVLESIAEIEHRFLREHSILFTDSLDLLETLRRSNLKLGLVTNASPSVWEVIRARRLEPLLDTIIVSSKVGIRKPDPGIYHEALRQLDVSAGETAFVGDGNDRELEGAKAIGMTTIKIDHSAFRAAQSEQSESEAVEYAVDSLSQITKILGL